VGIGLPAWMQWSGHAQIQTSLACVQLTPQDVDEQYARAVARHILPVSDPGNLCPASELPSHPLASCSSVRRYVLPLHYYRDMSLGKSHWESSMDEYQGNRSPGFDKLQRLDHN
jgi:hypothetical protein